MYRLGLVVWQLGWIDLDLGSSPGWWAGTVASYLLPKQDGGTSQIKVNPTQVRHQMGHLVLLRCGRVGLLAIR